LYIISNQKIIAMTKEEFRTLVYGKHEGDLSSQRADLCKAYDELYDSTLKKGGTGTAAAIAALEDVEDGAVYRCITTGGDVNTGGDAVTLAAGDLVYWDAATSLWVLLADVNA
jgi:hypothetical protein